MAREPSKQTLTTGDIAEHCHVSQSTVSRWIERGELPAYHLPGRGDRRVEVQDLLAFLKRNAMPLPEFLRPSSPRVLVVDDDARMTRALVRVLQSDGMETRVASSGFEAGEAIGSFEPDVVTLDLKMPGIDGFEILRFVRRTESLRDVKVIVLSAMPPAQMERALAEGADATMSKPFRNADLVREIRRLAGSVQAVDQA